MTKEIRLDGIIGDWGNTSEEFNFNLDELDLQADDELLVKINSVGGSVIEGWGIYNRLVSLENKVTTRGEGIVASIASLILMAGNTIEMSEVGALMIHRASNHVQGNAEDLEKAAEVLKTID
ncbi:Clp protease ClpP, partial [Candidatus Pacearchaeota archaeon]|nr:Clp protease ClpP [Candidatus Pacearchaeota archaeon]